MNMLLEKGMDIGGRNLPVEANIASSQSKQYWLRPPWWLQVIHPEFKNNDFGKYQM